MRKFTQISKWYILSFFFIITVCSSFFAPDKVRFSAMLIKKADIDKLFENKKFKYMVFQNWNRSTKDAKRQAFELIAYAFTSKNEMIAPFSPLKMITSVPDSSYSKEVYFENYNLSKSLLEELLKGMDHYSFLRFQPYEDKTDPFLANYICYSIYPVSADGISATVKQKPNKVLKIKMNPSPPR